MIQTLIVDDDFRVAALHRAYVERVTGFSVVGVAGTGAEALRMIQQRRPHLVLLDIYLPDISGLEILRTMRESDLGQVDVIAITAARDVESLRSAMHGGVVHYLIKPFRFNAFAEKLRSYAAMRTRLSQLSEADQHEVDRLYGILRPAHGEALPKGLARPTLELVRRVLREAAEDLTATEVAERGHLSRVTARRYLDHLFRQGEAEIGMRYGAPGRPEHLYRWPDGASASGSPRKGIEQ